MRRRVSVGQNKSYHAFLDSLKGKVVTIFHGGPESKTGQLLDVQSDYVTLYAQDDNNNKNENQDNDQSSNQNTQNSGTIIYYFAKHLKSISEDSQNNSLPSTQKEEDSVDYFQANNFSGLLKQLIHQTIQINQGGPESKQGVLLAVTDDFFAIFTEDDGVVYYNIQHVKSICKSSDDDQNDKNNNDSEGTQYPPVVNAEDFHDVFHHFAHNWVAINRGGPEAMEGVLVENSGGHYTLVYNQDVLRIHPYHVKSISCGPKGAMKSQNNSNNQNENNNKNQDTVENAKKNVEADIDEKPSSPNKSQEHNSNLSSGNKKESVVKTIDYFWKGKN